jgi:DNA-binding GntR family transcriptional regulator
VLSNLSVEKVTTVDRVADALRAEILAGGIAPGTPLREVEVASTTGVSRGSVRQAFGVLVNEGLLSRDSYRSVLVTTLDENDIREIYGARRVIELAAVDACAGAGDEQLSRIRRSGEEFIARVEEGDPDRIHLADVEVHSTLVAVLGSGRLSRVHSGLMRELRLVVSQQYEDTPDKPTLTRPHREFVELITAGQTDMARVQLAARLDVAEERMLGALRDTRRNIFE